MTLTASARRVERGFTIVEIIVAVTIVALVLGGVIWMVMSSAKASQRSDVRQKMAAAADGLAQQVRSNKDWLDLSVQRDPKSSCKVKACTPEPLDKYSYHPKNDNDPKFESAILVTPIDAPVDGLGAANDKDHILPDLYRISVTISLSEAEQAIWGQQKPFNLVSTVDATQLGKATGSLTVQVCRVANQVDERMAIAGCKAKAQQLEMRYQPPCAMDKTMTGPKVVADALAGKMLSLSCNAAIHEAKNIKFDGWAPGSVDVKPMPDQQFDIVPVDGTQAIRRDQRMADKVSGDGAAWTFTGLGTGTYEIDLKGIRPGLELWKSHVVPEDLKVGIQSNQEAKALVILRPVQATGSYSVAFSRMVYHYTLMTRTKVVMNVTPDPVHQAAIHSTTTYKYLEAKLTAQPVVPGASWNGYLAMEPKPFDRYRQAGSKTARQYIKPITWGMPAITFSAATGTPMPTGLYSRPEQLSLQQKGMYGQFDKEVFARGANMSMNQIYDREGVPLPIFNFHLGQGKMLCVPAMKCGNNYVYLDDKGLPNSSMLFNDAADGECYITSAVPQVPIAGLEITGGLEQDNTGLPGGDRCERDFMVNGMRIYNFLPDRSGQDGKTVLWRSSMTQVCVPSDQCIPRVIDPDRTMIPDGGTVVSSKTPTPLLPTPLRTDPSPIIRSSDAAYAAACGLTWGAGCAAVPPPSSMPALSVLPPLAAMMPPVPEPSAEDQQKMQACQNYMDQYQQTMQDTGFSEEIMSQQGFEQLECNPQCPSIGGEKPYANRPMRVFLDKEGQAYGGGDQNSFGSFTKAGSGIPMCAITTPMLPLPSVNPPIAPPVEPRPFTGPNPDTGGVPGIPVDFPLPVINGGTVAANGRIGVAGV